jgi:hypothetical protein
MRPGVPASPEVLEFSAANPNALVRTLLPAWEGQLAFTQRTCRGFAADGLNSELLPLSILGDEAQCWSFRDRSGKWSADGKLVFPWGSRARGTPDDPPLLF